MSNQGDVANGVFGCLRGRELHTGSLEVDATHLHRVRRVMRHHFGVAQKALGPGFGILALAAQRQAHEKSVKWPIIMTPHHYHSCWNKHVSI